MKLTQATYKRFRDLILERSGLYFPDDKRQVLERELVRVLRASACRNLDEYYELLRSSPSTSREWDRLVSVLTVGETYFFRNKGHFNALRYHILPELIAQRQHLNRRIRIWSAGCATGEEPYSIAILLRELIPNLDTWNILILATDINRHALRRAQEGVYSAWSFRGVDRRVQERYFSLNGNGQFVIADEIRKMVTFAYLNLVADHYPSLANNTHGMDVILCRNVTIYFKPEVTRLVVERLYTCLVEGGWLIPGASEPNMVTYRDFEARNFPGAVVYQKPVRTQEMAPVPIALPRVTRPQPPVSGAQVSRPKARPVGVEKGKAKEKPSPPAPPADPYQVAVELLQAGRVDEALVKLYEKLDQDPDFVPTYYALGKIYANKGNFEEAQHWCERAIERDRLQPEAYFTLSMIYQGQGLLDKAVDALKKTLYLDPTFVLAHYSLANLYQQQGNTQLARKSLRNVQRLLEGKPKEEPIPEGDGLVVGRLLELVAMALANGA